MSKTNNNLIVDLKPRRDKDGATYYVGKLKFPGTINIEPGVTFLVFISDNGEEQLQITQMNDSKDRDHD